MFRKTKMQMLLIALATIIITFLTRPTLAYYSVIGTATNVVTSGGIELKIHEKTADGQNFPEDGVYIIPGDIVGKRVTVENVCRHPFYLRVRLVSRVNNSELTAEECMRMDLNLKDWTLRDDGYLYYNVILQPGEMSKPVFTQVEIVGEKIDQQDVGTTLSLTVSAEAVQSEHNPADHPWEASGWPAAKGGTS